MQLDQYTRYKAYRQRTAPRSGQLGASGPPGAVGLGAFAESTSLADRVASLIAEITSWSANEGSRVQAYINDLAALSSALSKFLSVPAIADQFGTQIAGIVGALSDESNRASAYLATLG